MKASEITKENLPSLRIRERLLGKSQTDIILFWFKSEEKFDLNEKEKEMRDRWMSARAKFMELASYKETVEHLMAEFDISVAQARIDVKNMQAVFADIEKVSKDAHRARAIEMATRAYKMAEQQKDPKGMAKATQVYFLAAWLDKEEPDRIDIEKIMADRTYAEILDPAIRSIMLTFIQKGAGLVDAAELFQNITDRVGTETIDYEELTEDDDDGTH